MIGRFNLNIDKGDLIDLVVAIDLGDRDGARIALDRVLGDEKMLRGPTLQEWVAQGRVLAARKRGV